MPSIITTLKIGNVSPSSNVINGDALIVSATSSIKINTGAHSIHVGDIGVSIVNNAASSTNTLDPCIGQKPRVI